MRFLQALTLLAVVVTATAATAQTPMETQVLEVINAARADPAGYVQTLRTFRTYFHQVNYVVPGSNVVNATEEGVAAVDDAIGAMTRQRAAPPIGPGLVLAVAAADHVAEQGADGSVGHASADGADPGERARRRGGGDYVAEVIEYGATDAVDAVRQLIVDDGVADRGHRQVLFDPRLRFAGVACGPHPVYRTMCVIDLGVTGDGRPLGRMELADAQVSRSFGR